MLRGFPRKLTFTVRRHSRGSSHSRRAVIPAEAGSHVRFSLDKKERSEKTHVLMNGFKELKIVWDQLKHIPVLKSYLTAFFFYSMGVQTVKIGRAHV